VLREGKSAHRFMKTCVLWERSQSCSASYCKVENTLPSCDSNTLRFRHPTDAHFNTLINYRIFFLFLFLFFFKKRKVAVMVMLVMGFDGLLSGLPMIL
jgi:hypothetical protein